MVGAVILAHLSIGEQLISTVEYILGKIEGIVAVTIDRKMDAFEVRNIISGAIKKVDRGDGVLILTDLLGGSPCNIAFSFLNNEKVEIITGVNLPMIIRIASQKQEEGLESLARAVHDQGRSSISLVSKFLPT